MLRPDLFRNNVVEKLIPRDYQEVSVRSIIDYIKSATTFDKKRGVYVGPVACGKSFIIALAALELGEPILVLQPSKELLGQNYEKYTDAGGVATIFSASMKMKVLSSNTYATLGSIKNQAAKLKKLGVRYVFIDECHKGYSPEEKGVARIFLEALDPTCVVGFTATPVRLEYEKKNGLQKSGMQIKFITSTNPTLFNDVIHIVQISEIKQYWPDISLYEFDFDESALVTTKDGTDFTDKSASEAVEKNKVNRNICMHLKSISKERKSTLVFVDSVASAHKFSKWCNESLGLNTAVVYGGMNLDLRSDIVEEFKNLEIDVIFNFGTLTTGFDHPELDCVVLGRPMNSYSDFYQMIGRGLRIHIEKENCMVLDFCNNFRRMGDVRKMEILHVPYWGWAIFVGGKLLTDIPIKGPKLTLEQTIVLGKTREYNLKKPRIGFGQYTECGYEKLVEDPGYLRYLLPKIEAKIAEEGKKIPKKYIRFVEMGKFILNIEKELKNVRKAA